MISKANCEKCPFAKDGKPNQPVLGEGPADAIGILVGESPGEDETREGRPFVGVTGRQLDYELAAAGLQRWKLFLVNAILCRPLQGKTESQMLQAVRCCRPVLLAQLAQFPDDIPVLAMGKWAYSGLLGKDTSVGDNRGFVNHEFKLPREEEEDDA